MLTRNRAVVGWTLYELQKRGFLVPHAEARIEGEVAYGTTLALWDWWRVVERQAAKPVGVDEERGTVTTPPAARASETKPFETIMNDTLIGILKALDGRAMRVEKLAQEVTGGESSRLYRDGMKTVLVKDGHIVLDRRIGYFRPDKPPADRVLPAAKLGAKK